MLDSAIIKYSCGLMNRRLKIGLDAINSRRGLSDAEKTELEWISIKIRLIRKVQMLR